MSIAFDEIQHRILKAIPDAVIHLEDMNDDGSHYSAWIKSDLFHGKSRVQQHQMIYAALGEAFQKELHAMSLKTEVLNKEK